MKIAQQFRAFLEMHNYLVLPNIGRFEALTDEANPLNGEIEKRLVKFTPDIQVVADNELTAFICQKMKIDDCIALSDLKSFCNSLKELFLQGFEAEIPGIGFLHLDSKNQLKFSGKSIYNTTETKSKKRPAALFSSTFWL